MNSSMDIFNVKQDPGRPKGRGGECVETPTHNLHQFWYKEDNRLFLYTGNRTFDLRRKQSNIKQTENFIKNEK